MSAEISNFGLIPNLAERIMAHSHSSAHVWPKEQEKPFYKASSNLASLLVRFSLRAQSGSTLTRPKELGLKGREYRLAKDAALTRSQISELFDRYSPMVFRRAMKILGSAADAEEATQEIFIRAFNNADQFRRESQASTWLYRITVNYCLNRLRDRKRRRELWDVHVAPDSQDHNQSDAKAENLVMLRSVLANSDEQSARAAIHVYMEGMSHAEAAKLLNVSRRTVGNLLERFCAEAREKIKREGGDGS